MKGLVLKDLYSLLRFAKLYIVYIVVFSAVTIFTGEPAFFGAMVGVVVFSLPISTFSMDEQCGWDSFAVAMPVSRNTVVAGKYIICGVFIILATVVLSVVSVITMLAGDKADLEALFFGGFTSMLTISLMLMVILPFIFKMGAEKGRIIMFIAFGFTFAVIMGGAALLKEMGVQSDSVPQASGWIFLAVFLAILVLATWFSYRISCGIYHKKEF